MRKLTIVVIALFVLFRPERSEASLTLCKIEGNCPTIELLVTDAATGKPAATLEGAGSPFLVNALELLDLEAVTSFQPPATATGLSPLFWFGTSEFTATGSSNQPTSTGANFFFTGYFDKPGDARLELFVFDDLGNAGCLGPGECSGPVFQIEASVPEPSTWAMLLIGFAGIGFAGYRKSRWRKRRSRYRAASMDEVAAGEMPHQRFPMTQLMIATPCQKALDGTGKNPKARIQTA
jgi:hypothetical protein